MRKIYLISTILISFILTHELDFYHNGAISAYTKTPSPGKITVDFLALNYDAKKGYDENGEAVNLGINKVSYSEFGTKIDYYGMHGVGLNFGLSKINTEGDYTGGIDSENNNPGDVDYIDTPDGINDDIKITSISSGAYMLWNDIDKGLNHHQFTFSINRIKVGTVGTIYIYDNDPIDSKAGGLTYFAMDIILRDDMIWTNKIQAAITDSGFSFYSFIKSKFIYHVNPNFSGSLEFVDLEGFTSTTNILNSEIDDDILTSSAQFLNISAGYQLPKIKAGYLNLYFKIQPTFSIQLDGGNFLKANPFGVKITADFK